MIRTRFAPSPTGSIHIGNLRTAIYSYLIAKHNNGRFILRIEDTDQKRSENMYVDKIYDALNKLGIKFDESPKNPNKEYEPYIQSERVKSGIYMKYALQLIEQGDAYYCFCPDCHSDLERYKPEVNYGHIPENENYIGYNGHCRNLTKEEIEKNLRENKSFVIRQKIKRNKTVVYKDKIYGEISFNTNELEDQVLIKQDGYPTYNFANVIDDHLMGITHVVRGNEYLSSTPKYVLLYNSFNWEVPEFIHLSLIFTRNQFGEEKKMSKRDDCASFESMIENGYLPEAILNYIALLGYGVEGENEVFSLKELVDNFNFEKIGKSTKIIFDKEKLDWFNYQYMIKLNQDDYIRYCKQYCEYHFC